MALSGYRQRSSTITSIQSSSSSSQPPAPLAVGEHTTLLCWVQDNLPGTIRARINLDAWPGVREGDLLAVTRLDQDVLEGGELVDAFLFIASEMKGSAMRTNQVGSMQISISSEIATAFGFHNRAEVRVTKVDKDAWTAEHIELCFRDQYLGRSEMWRLGMSLEETCVHDDQKVTFASCIEAQISGIFVGGHKVPSAYVTALTKTIYRSLSARHTLLIQISKELWEFAEDGERYYEKLCTSFLPELFSRWRNYNAHHLLSVVLISRVWYDDAAEAKLASGPLQESKTTKKKYKDLYKVIIDLEIMEEWETTLLSLKQSLWDFQREILLQHITPQEEGDTLEACLIGRISHAHEGNILEAINLALNPFEKYHVDRDMGRTGLSISVVTPGTGRFEVDKELLRLTNERMNFNGFTVDLVCLTHRPLHAVPLFSYMSQIPEQEHSLSQREQNPLYYDSNPEQAGTMMPAKDLVQYHMIPSWVYCSYWERSWDMPFRIDRFIPRCRMYEIQMLGLLEQDISSTISIPFLDEDASLMFGKPSSEGKKAFKEKARRDFSRNVFGRKPIDIPGQPFTLGYNSGSTLSVASRGSAKVREPPGGALALRTSFRPSQFDDSRRSSLSQRIDGFPAIPAQELAHARRNSLQMPAGIIKLPPLLPIDEPPRGRPTRVTPLSPSPPNEPTPTPTPAPAPPPPPEKPAEPAPRSASPSKASIKSTKSTASGGGSEKSAPKQPRMFSASWLLSTLRPQPALPQTTSITVNRQPPTPTKAPEAPKQPAAPTGELAPPTPQPIKKASTSKDGRPAAGVTGVSPVPISIKARQQSVSRPTRPGSELYSDAPLIHPSRASYPRNSLHPEGTISYKGGSAEAASTPQGRYRQISTGLTLLNPSNPKPEQLAESAQEARRWKYSFARPTFEHQMKWRSLCMPACLPLTVDIYPRQDELDKDFRTYHHTILVPDVDSQFIRPPKYQKDGYTSETYQAEQLLRAIASFRLAQGFQFVVAPHRMGKKQTPLMEPNRLSGSFGRAGMVEPSSSHVHDISLELRPGGASEVLRNIGDAPIYLSMGNQIHRISYDKELQEIKVTIYIRGRQREDVLSYECLIWPKYGSGYMRSKAQFSYPAEHIGWNRMDMLIAGASSPLADRMRYWRTRFVVIPSEEEPDPHYEPGATGARLSNEEIRIQGMNHLAELFGRLRWTEDGRIENNAPVPLLLTYLDPLACLLDEPLMESLAEAHLPRASERKRKAEKTLEGASLASIARAMRDPDGGLVIEDHKWHNNIHKDSFSGSDFVSFLMREYRDVSTREEATEWGNKLMEQGLIEHCRSYHMFLDGHYYYRLAGEYAVTSQNKRQRKWFNRHAPSRDTRKGASPAKRQELVLTQSITLDLDPMKHSDQAELVMLHHDVIHNPDNAYHFEMNWIGTTARYIDDVVWSWARSIEEFGLKLVEAYVDQISDISTHSPFQSCISIPLASEPPVVPDLARRLQLGSNPGLYFEAALLRHLGYILDIESVSRYPEQVTVKYSYRHSPYTYPQYIHRSGLAFVQIVGGTDGFLWLANGLAIAGAVTRRLKQKQWEGNYAFRDQESPQPARVAEGIRLQLQAFCADSERLRGFWDRTMRELPAVREEHEELIAAA